MPKERSGPARKKYPATAHRRPVEPLEPRQLLSATATPAVLATPAAHGGSFNGYTPAQIRHAYGFDQINATGKGQTIAIVDAFDDPTIVQDLKVFDAKYGLPDPVISKIGQNGRRLRGVASDRGWASEIALDVEWAHAIAPDANIVLVETNSDSTDDLLAGVNAARNVPGVSVISLSWGSDEYRSQISDDNYFLTPRGHVGITVVAAAGDEGHAPAEWPATSPNVVGVGGTTLTLTNAGNYAGETVWSDTTGGTSLFEPVPAWQSAVSGTRMRSTPDVSFNANPDTGFAVYDSYGSGGWTVVAGTSAGVPQWGALVALANQVRADNGLPALDGPTGTLPALYSMYGSSATSATYVAAFNDITAGSNTGGGGSDSGGNRGGGIWGPPRRWDVVANPAAATAPAIVSMTNSAAPAASGPAAGDPGAAATTTDTGGAATASATPAADPSADAAPAPVATPAASRISAAAAKNGSATTGYDQVTGLGTPKAAAVVNGLATYAPPVLSRSRRRARQAAAVAAAAKQKAHHSIARPGQTDTPSTGTPSPTPSDVPATASPVASTAPAAFASRDAFATATDPVPSALQQLLTTIAQGPSVGVNRTTTMAAVFTSLPDQASAAVIGGGSHAGTDGDAGPVSAESRVISVVAPVMAAVAPIVAPGAVAQASAADGPAAVAASETLSMAGLSFAPLDAASAFGDALALFAHESTQTLLPGGTLAVTAAGAAKEMKAGTLRAWAVTLGVLAADAILAGRWVRRRQRRRRRAAEEAALEIAGGLFSLAPVTSPALDELDDDGDGEYVI